VKPAWPVVACLLLAPTPAGASDAACDAKPKAAKLNFTLKDINGTPVSLASFKGKVIILDFWATWCVPCKAEIPSFVNLQNRYGESGLQVIGISVDDPVEKLRPYVAELKINYPVLQGRGHDAVLDAFAPNPTLPTSIVIGRDGKICRTHSGIASEDVFEKEILALGVVNRPFE
jgi:peroxiredoxin